MPVSVTATCSTPSSAVGRTPSRHGTTTSPFSVNLIALPTRLTSTWRSRPESAIKRVRARRTGRRRCSSSPFSWARSASASQRVVERVAQRELRRVEVKLARFDLREVEDVVDELQQRVRRALHHAEILALLRRQLGVERELGHADDAVHRRADLVAHVRQELALRAAPFFRLVLGGRAGSLLVVVSSRVRAATSSSRWA